MTCIAIIPARAGSVRIPGKNKRPFMGKPIIEYSITAARESKLFAHVFVSTDDPEIAEIANAAGAIPLVRLQLVDGESGTQEVMGHVLRTQTEAWKPQYACCIYPTAPMMTPGDLIRGWNRLCVPRTVYAMSVGTEPLHDPGQWYFGIAKAFQDGLPLLDINTGIVPIPKERCCDINTEEDWNRAERMYQDWQESMIKERTEQT